MYSNILIAVMNPNPKVRSSRRVYSVALYTLLLDLTFMS